MFPPPTTIAVSTPLRCTSAISAATTATRAGSMPYSRSPISASPDSFRRMRRNGEALAACSCATGSTLANSGDRVPGVVDELGTGLSQHLLDRRRGLLVPGLVEQD